MSLDKTTPYNIGETGVSPPKTLSYRHPFCRDSFHTNSLPLQELRISSADIDIFNLEDDVTDCLGTVGDGGTGYAGVITSCFTDGMSDAGRTVAGSSLSCADFSQFDSCTSILLSPCNEKLHH